MKKSVDARGRACPQPVIMSRKVLAEGGLDEIEIVVDNAPARENVVRFLKFTGAAEPRVASAGSVHTITAAVSADMVRKAAGAEPAPSCDDETESAASRSGGKTVFLPTDQIGRGDESLGKLLVKGFLYTLGELAVPPRVVVLMNAGVRLATEREDTIPHLKTLAAKGVDILVCGTCLDYYHLTEKLAVGRVSHMYEIAGRVLEAADVVTVS